MAKKKSNQNLTKTWRATPEDQKLIAELRERLGIDETSLIRLGLRTLANYNPVTESKAAD